MKQVNSFEEILGMITRIKTWKKGYLTNFFPDRIKTELWIKLSLLEFGEYEETIFVTKKNTGFYNLYFISTNPESLGRSLILFYKTRPNDTIVSDIVGEKGGIDETKNLFINCGFYEYTSLSRMISSSIKQNSDKIYSSDNRVSTTDGVGEVYKMLYSYFDPFAEQLPLMEEFESWKQNQQIAVFNHGSLKCGGFVIFELIGITSYLRYWFVHPDFRDKGVGSALLNHYFYASRNAKRLIFWVIESNINAIKRYEHYGFKEEQLIDFVMINKNVSYERKNF